MRESPFITGGRTYVGKQVESHVAWCKGCGDPIYAEQVIKRGTGVEVVKGTNDKRPIETVLLCPKCEGEAWLLWFKDYRLQLATSAISKLVKMGAPQSVIHAEARIFGLNPEDVEKL